jgi:hypothetical protein
MVEWKDKSGCRRRLVRILTKVGVKPGQERGLRYIEMNQDERGVDIVEKLCNVEHWLIK